MTPPRRPCFGARTNRAHQYFSCFEVSPIPEKSNQAYFQVPQLLTRCRLGYQTPAPGDARAPAPISARRGRLLARRSVLFRAGAGGSEARTPQRAFPVLRAERPPRLRRSVPSWEPQRARGVVVREVAGGAARVARRVVPQRGAARGAAQRDALGGGANWKWKWVFLAFCFFFFPIFPPLSHLRRCWGPSPSSTWRSTRTPRSAPARRARPARRGQGLLQSSSNARVHSSTSNARAGRAPQLGEQRPGRARSTKLDYGAHFKT